MFGLRRIVCLAVMFVGMEAQIEVDPLKIQQVCVNELLGLIDNPTNSVCGEYTLCLVLSLKLHQSDLSMKEIEDLEEPYQEELVRLGVECVLSFSVVIERLKGPITTASSSVVPATTTASTPTTTPTTTTTITTTMSTTTATTTVSSSSTEKSTPMSTTISSTTVPTTATTTSAIPTPTTPKYTTTTITRTTTVTPTTTRKPTAFPTTLSSTSKIASSPKTTISSSTTTDYGVPDCIKDTDNGCARRQDGDYPTCFPVCQKGVYITCSNGRTVIRDCQFGWYTSPKRLRFLARILFHPTTKRCEYKTAYCPRQLEKGV